ncbi:hypothetical protein SAMN05444001_102204 [Parabacteroides chinchillae]|uniref:Kelch motif-containing protein n=2 Tax=Parabacteroides chinchillae TaxID=871327 RepID=A0A8G2BUG3_9BACT|nr:hypothetical protein SAMN05444001_102204 [Parabacteroides chinchillae]
MQVWDSFSKINTMKYLYSIISFFLITNILSGCIEDPDMETGVKNAKIPTVNTLIDDQHTIEKLATTVSFYAEVVSGNGLPVEKYGVCWGLESEPTIEKNDTTVCGKGLGKFRGIAHKLKPNTLYYIRPYAINAKGTNYGKEITVNTTKGLGVVATVVVSDSIKAESVICGGKIVNHGEGIIKDRGVYLTTPTTKDSVIPIIMNADSFVCKITKLDTSTIYIVKAYVENEFGIFAGEPQTFKTTNGLPVVTSLKEVAIGFTDGSFEAEVSNEGDSAVTVRGLCWGFVSGTMLENGDTTINGAGKGKFTGKATKLKSDKMYYMRAYAKNAYGTAYSNEISFWTKSDLPRLSAVEIARTDIGGTLKVSAAVLDEGAMNVIESGISYSLTKDDKVGNTKVELSSGKNSYEGEISGLKGGSTYYIRAYAINKDGVITYGEETSYTTPDIFSARKVFEGNNQIGGAVAVTAMGSSGLILGGDIGAEATNEFWEYRAYKNEWLQRNSFPVKRKWQTAINIGSAVIAFGGVGSDNVSTKDLYLYSLFTNYWEQITYDETNAPDARYLSAGFAYKDSVFIVGGIRSGSITDEVWSIKPANAEKWVKKSTFPEKQCRGIAVVIGDKIYAGLGNKDWVTPSYSRKLYVSTDGANTWKELNSINANVRCGVAFDNNIYVVDDVGYIWKYDITTNSWTLKSQLPSGNRDIYCMYSLDGLIYLGQGTSGSSIISYDPSWDN